MFLLIKPILDRRPRRDGTCVISIQYCFNSDKRTLLFTGLSIPPRYWNKKLARISSDLPSHRSAEYFTHAYFFSALLWHKRCHAKQPQATNKNCKYGKETCQLPEAYFGSKKNKFSPILNEIV